LTKRRLVLVMNEELRACLVLNDGTARAKREMKLGVLSIYFPIFSWCFFFFLIFFFLSAFMRLSPFKLMCG